MIYRVKIESSDPESIKKDILIAALEIIKNKGAYKVYASLSQNILFKSQHGYTIERYLADAIGNQKPIHKRRSLQ